MIRSLILFSLRFPWVVLGLAVGLLVAGAVRLQHARWDVFPEFAPPQIVVQTEAPGLSTEEVEQLIAIPVESVLGGVSRLKTLRSSSVPGLCVVTAVFEEGTNVLTARQLVSERLTEVRTLLPDTAENPRLMPLTSSTSRLVMIGLTADGATSPQMLRTYADWTLRRRLQAVAGVAHVEVFGGDVKQYQIQVSPLRLQEYGVTLDEIVSAGKQATGFGGAGYTETANQRLPIRQRTRLEGTDDLAAVPVAVRDGVSLTLGQVANVRVAAADQVGSTTINGNPGVLFVVHKQPDFNTLTVTASVNTALGELQSSLPSDVTLHPLLFQQAAFIDRAISNLTHSLLLGCGLVAVVLVLFLMNARVLLISLTAMPLSLMGAILALLSGGATLNAMTLGGLAIALGEVVDDAIVDVENVLRRLQENRLAGHPKSIFDIVLEASLEVRSAVVYASFIVMLVFLPVFFLDGLAGKLFGPLGLAYVVAILVSLTIALTVTPAMCLLMLGTKHSLAEGEPWLVRISNAVYRRILPPFIHRPSWVLFSAVGMLVVSGMAVPFLGGEFLPDFRESNFVVFMAGKPDSSLVESERVGKKLAKQLLEISGVRSVAQQIGRADLSEDTWGPNISEVWISLADDADYDSVLAEVREVLEGTPGYAFQAKQFLRERIDEVLTGSTADLLVRIVGPDLQVLRKRAEPVAAVMNQVRGVKDLRVEQLVDVPQVDVLLKPRTTAEYGLSVGATNQAIQTWLRGTQVGQVFEGDTVVDVVVRGASDLRADPHLLSEIQIDGPLGHPIPLGTLADVSIVAAPNMINREQGRRRLLVTCNAEGRDVESVMTEIRHRLQSEVPLPAGYHYEFAGEFAAKAEAQQRMIWLSATSLLGILVLLYLDFRRLRLCLLVMFSVPLACVGGVLSVYMSGGDLSLGSLVGFVTVFGVAVRNGILLISNYEHLRERGEALSPALILKGSVERLAPILMTAGTTALAIIPLVVAGNLPGHEIEHPMAVVIMGGLLSSTLLTLFVLPTVYLKFAEPPSSMVPHPHSSSEEATPMKNAEGTPKKQTSPTRSRWLIALLVSLALAAGIMNGRYYLEKYVFARINALGGTVHFQTDPSWSATLSGKVHLGVSVNLKGCNLQARDLFLLRWIRGLRALSISESHFPVDGLRQLQGMSSLIMLDLSRASLTSEDFFHLPELPKLVDLRLNGTQVTDTTIVSILKKYPRLDRLELENTEVTDKGVAVLGILTELTAVNLDGTKLTDRGLVVLANLPLLAELHVGRTRISDHGLIPLEHCPKLESLSLTGTSVTNEAIAILCRFPNLEELNLDYTQVSDEGLERLPEIRTLEGVSVVGSKVTIEGMRVFRERFPGLSVRFEE